MRYGKIFESIWNDEKFCQASDGAQNLYVYLLSSSNGNSVGIFRIGYGQIEDEYCKERALIKERMTELQELGLVCYDEHSKWLYFNQYLKWNVPQSPNHAKSLGLIINDLVAENAPKDAICMFLASAKKILLNLSTTRKDKTGNQCVKNYFGEFKSGLNEELIIHFVGTRKDFDNLLNGLTSEVLQKYLPSTTEVLPSTRQDLPIHTRTRTSTRTSISEKNKNHKVLVPSNSNSNKEADISILCANGQTRLIEPSAVALVMKKTGFDTDEARRCIQFYNMTHVQDRPQTPDDDIRYADVILGSLKHDK